MYLAQFPMYYQLSILTCPPARIFVLEGRQYVVDFFGTLIFGVIIQSVSFILFTYSV